MGGEDEGKGLVEGSTCLVVGSPGSGKTLLGLQFLWPVGAKERPTEPCLWLSFEGEIDQLRMSTHKFKDKAQASFGGLISSFAEGDRDSGCYFQYVFPGHVDQGRFFHLIDRFVAQNGVRKIVFDSISDLRERFKDQVDFKEFIHSLIYYLNRKGVTTMFLYRLPVFFGDFEILGVDITSMVDTILVLRNFDIHNQVQKGVFVLKVRGREHRSRIRSVLIKEEAGLEVLDLGWSFENLLSGKPPEIKEPEIFLKFFYENPGEENVNRLALKEFKGRYNRRHQFCTLVRKDQIHIDHWSFTEKKGPGHSNVKVVSLAKYWAVALHEKNRLQPLKGMIPSEKLQDRIRDTFWRLCLDSTNDPGPETAFWPEEEKPSKEHQKKFGLGAEVYLIPYYVDLFCLAFDRELIGRALGGKLSDGLHPHLGVKELRALILGLDKLREEEPVPLSDLVAAAGAEDGDPPGREVTWADLRSFGHFLVERLQGMGGDDVTWLAFPSPGDVTSFVPAFMQLVWALGGDIFNLAERKDAFLVGKEGQNVFGNLRHVTQVLRERGLENSVLKNGRAFEEAVTMLLQEIASGSMPNPIDGDARKQAVFAPSWYSRIADLVEPEGKRQPHEVRRDRFGSLLFPRHAQGDPRLFAAYDVNCLGLIRDPISPETGWLFIDALNSPEYVSDLERQQIGFPANEARFQESTASSIDPDAYQMARRIIFEDAEQVPVGESQEMRPRHYRKDLSKIPYFYRIERAISRALRDVFLQARNLGSEDLMTRTPELAEDFRKKIKAGIIALLEE